jgi:hypothetical protein
MSDAVTLEIKDILEKKKIMDLKRFLERRKTLNLTNSYLIYIFYFVQSAGILTTSFAAGTHSFGWLSNDQLIWCGIMLNILASLIHVYEKTNNSILKKTMKDIKAIKDGTYIDEGELVEPDEDKKDSDSVIYMRNHATSSGGPKTNVEHDVTDHDHDQDHGVEQTHQALVGESTTENP